mmetsp:Transcript_2990/g.6887  ORF Transcript_2990/g.6887 Transcript_2990/m.6887 type:complete len:288 (+) Transcript_2990:345-1208(+)
MLRGQTGPEDDFWRLRFEVFSLSHQPSESECRLRIVRRNHGTTAGAAEQRSRDQPHAQVCELLLPRPARPPEQERAICGREVSVSARQENLQQAVWEVQVWLSKMKPSTDVDVVKQDHGAALADDSDPDDPDPDPHYAMVLPFAACPDLFRAGVGAEPEPRPFYWRGWLPTVDYEHLRREDEYAAVAGDSAVAGWGEGGGGSIGAAASSAGVLLRRHVAALPELSSGEAVAPQKLKLDIGLTLLQHAESVPYLEDAPITDLAPSVSQRLHGEDLFQRVWTRTENQGL